MNYQEFDRLWSEQEQQFKEIMTSIKNGVDDAKLNSLMRKYHRLQKKIENTLR